MTAEPKPEFWATDAATFAKLERMAERLCAGSDKMRDEGNLLVVLLRGRFYPLNESDLTNDT